MKISKQSKNIGFFDEDIKTIKRGKAIDQIGNRIFSIDFFRVFTMFMLVGGFEGLFNKVLGKNSVIISFFERQFSHAPWNGLNFWDLIHPFFIFIVGVAMPFSLSRRWDKGDSWEKTFYHVLRRCFLLLIIGWAISSSPTTSNFQNILTQLSVNYLIAFLIIRKAIKWQLLISFALILVSDLLYRFWPVEGFNQPFIADQNFGSWTDMVLTGHLQSGHWAPFNAIPTSAITIWGVIVGMLLMKEWCNRKKIIALLITGLIGIIIGYAMNPYIPIIKRIATSSYIIVSGGWCLVGMAVSHWLTDVINLKKVGLFFAIFGMNSIFIYLFASSLRSFFGRLVNPFVYRLFFWSNETTITVISAIIIAAMLWYVCYFLYKRKVFIKL